MKAIASCLALLVVVMLAAGAKPDPKEKEKDAAKETAPAVSGAPAFETIKSLAGVWETVDGGTDGKKSTIEFKLTAGGSVVVETMFPGHKHEMVNTYHMDGDKLMVTHYCAQGVQPRMKLARGDAQQMQFEFVDCTNLKEGAGCMGGLEMQTDGEKLVEKWYYRTDGKLGEATTFELRRKK